MNDNDNEEKTTQENTEDAHEALTGDPGLFIESTDGERHRAYIKPDGAVDWDKMTPEDKDYFNSLPDSNLSSTTQRVAEMLSHYSEEIAAALEQIAELDNNKKWQQLCAIFSDIDELVDIELMDRGAIGASLFWLTTIAPMLAHIDSLQSFIKNINFNGTFIDFITAPPADPDTGKQSFCPFTVWCAQYGNEDILSILQAADNPAPVQNPLNITRLNTPKYYVSASNNVTNSLPQIINKGPKDITVGSLGRNKPLKINASVSIPIDENRVQIYGDYTEFDRSVHDCLCTIYIAGYDAFTLPELSRLVAANLKLNPSKDLLDEVTTSLEKMQIIDIKCDMSGIVSLSGYDLENPKVKEKMVRLGEIEGTLNGQPVNFFCFRQEPILLEISEILHQTQSTPIEMREIKKIGMDGKPGKIIPATSNRIQIRDYLLREIQAIKDDTQRAAESYRKYEGRRRKSKDLPLKPLDDFRHMKTVILYDTVFKVCGLEGQSRQTRINNVLYIKDCLNYWVNQSLIRGYKEAPGERKDAPRGIQIVP